ncbi:SGNH/GDSL hydrolase family protein [Flavobacterium jejuense]|uniref:SGNH/GDSL hydrolase family protein n=1 Tax=Flavobacterium jejuense TaxID=1544455 RepID=A0ABX0IP61_9FLAO|nr:SGNH/GDSL hydrolase family protein [Flavobacterium jejuense]NHN25021.1 SGNH/GDSL hydrolase family protein [Flavobacterium jejuense]
MKLSSFFYPFLIGLTLCSFQKEQTNTNPKEKEFICSGRIERVPNGNVKLISSASSISFNFKGNNCSVYLKSDDTYEHHNYVSLELDGKYIGRLKVEKGESKAYPIAISEKKKKHHLTIYKATEAANGSVLFSGTTAEVVKNKCKNKTRKRIEFIGNSITCGMGNDTKEIPCGTGEWYDQHNAYWAYGSILSRSLKVDFQLSSVSGIGMYRNWNDEHLEEAIMPDVYENLYLNKDNSKPYDFNFHPDIVSICLGTNDLSEGDGTKPRLPFNEEKYVTNYINFIKTIYKHNPKVKIALLTSPMVSGKRNETLVNCLMKVMAYFEKDKTHKKIALFEYKPMEPKGCGYHPDIEDHKIMAAQLEPFFKKIVHEK